MNGDVNVRRGADVVLLDTLAVESEGVDCGSDDMVSNFDDVVSVCGVVID